jgi:RecA-family ATPase
LQTMTFQPLKFILPGLVPEGATLLVSRPKFGKSWFVLDIAIAIAAGRFTLGQLKPVQGDVLYLALEDGPRRLQRRITKLLPSFSGSWPSSFKIATEWPRADQGGLDDIEHWLRAAKTPRLVTIDTLAQFRKLSNGRGQVYADDYAAIAGLQKLAQKYDIAIIIVHHDRKAEADDVFDTISGSLGLSAAADTLLIMKRQSGSVTLHVRGRDVEETELALQFSKETCRWTILGSATDLHRSAERNVSSTC